MISHRRLAARLHFAPAGCGDFWTTVRGADICEQNRGCQNLNTVAPLEGGISIETAAAGMELIARQLQRQYPATNRDFVSAIIVPLRDIIVGEVRRILLVLLSAAGILLLIAWVNVATLLLVRSDSRRREIAVRGSLGATSATGASVRRRRARAGDRSGMLGLVFSGWGMR